MDDAPPSTAAADAMSCTVETMPDMADDVWLSSLLRYGIHDLDDGDAVQSMAAALATRGPVVDSGGTATHELLGALNEVWERGWQPADVVHAARKDATAGSVSLAVALIGEDARRTDAASRAPEAWIDQLREMGALTSGDPAVVAGWHRAERRSPADAWRIVLLLARVLRTAVRIETLLPPPSRWGPPRSRPAGESPAGDERERVLRRIRGLLAKAESTEFPEEAEALTAKAQELMTRYAVDAAVLDTALLGTGVSSAGAVAARRVHVADPYVRAKMQLLAAVAEANDVRLVWYSSLGIANLVGLPADVAAVELLFTSLLLQVAQALAAAERAQGRRSASRSFRRSFLLGYAHRIGERLKAAQQRATAAAAAERGTDLLPVLRSRREAVEKATAELFPRVRTSRSRASVDAGGWYAGRQAAERADVGHRRSSLR